MRRTGCNAVLIALCALGVSTRAAETQDAKAAWDRRTSVTNAPAMLMFNGQKLFELSGISSVSSKARVETMIRRLNRTARSPLVSTKDITLHHDGEFKVSLIMHDADVLCAVWESDAEYHGIPRQQLAEQWLEQIKDAVDQWRQDRTTSSFVKGTMLAAAVSIVLLLFWLLVTRLFSKEMKAVETRFTGQQMLKFLDGDTIVTINSSAVKVMRAVIFIVMLITYLNIVLSLFPWTFNISARLFDLISTPFIRLGRGFIANLDKLFALAVIILIARYVLMGLRHIFKQIAEGKVRIRGFYQDWADTTYTLVKTVIIVFAAVVAWPYIPGSDSAAFKGISIFMGVLVSLGSTSAVGNIFGGLILTYMRAFQSGDFVEINGMRGTVMASRTFSTRLKTPTNEIISIPNALVAANHIINYSRMTKSIGVNIGTTVSIGYDVPWRKVHELLLKSAEGVPDVLEDPPPTVLQLELDDFYVKYKLVISTKEPAKQFRILSNINQKIQDNFAAAAVEIMSPHYRANRAGEAAAIPGDPGIAESSPENNDN